MPIPSWIPLELDRVGLAYQLRHHDAAYTSRQLAEHEHVSGYRVAKVVVALAEWQPVLLVVPATQRIDLRRARESLGIFHLRLADEVEMAQLFPDCEIGALPPLRHWPDIDVWVDPALLEAPEILFPIGTHEDAALVDCRAWRGVVKPHVAPLGVSSPT